MELQLHVVVSITLLSERAFESGSWDSVKRNGDNLRLTTGLDVLHRITTLPDPPDDMKYEDFCDAAKRLVHVPAMLILN